MLNIVIPMAGAGTRFQRQGFKTPKPLIQINHKPMIQWVVENVTPAQKHQFIFVCQREHLQNYLFESTLKKISPGCRILDIEALTEGPACTVLRAQELIDDSNGLMIVNSDQWVTTPIDTYLNAMENNDGLIMTMIADHPKWSYARLDEDGYVSEVVEKQVISREATVGIYNFARGEDFVRAAHQMIRLNKRVNNEFYVGPTYNEMLSFGKKVKIYNVGYDSSELGKKEPVGMFGLGTPEDLNIFLTAYGAEVNSP